MADSALTGRPVDGPSRRDRFVCENPTIVETAADDLWPRCPPLVCTDGIASGATLDLIAGLARAGCSLKVRADIDPAGFTVVEQVHSVAPSARLRRFDVHVYAEMHDLAPRCDKLDDVGLELTRLREAHDRHQFPLHEERILNLLIADLRAASNVVGSTAAQRTLRHAGLDPSD